MNKVTLLATLLLLLCGVSLPVQSSSLSQLLENIRQEKYLSRQENKKREKAFLAQRDQQKKLMQQAQKKRSKVEQQTAALKEKLANNEKKLAELQQEITEKSAGLGELYGVVRQISGQSNAIVQHSIISAQYPDRGIFLQALADQSSLPTTKDLNKLWFELQREMTESGKISRFSALVIDNQGHEQTREVTRIGAFNLIAENQYLQFLSNSQQIIQPQQQPPASYQHIAGQFAKTKAPQHAFVLDPTRGDLLTLIAQMPNMQDRILQGGIIGFVILTIGGLALLIAIERYLSLSVIGYKMARQRKNATPQKNNPLGRIMAAVAGKSKDIESMNLHLDEAILKETPRLEKRINLLAIFAAIAPLLGLLGTVVGMIETFQSIALFGTGDPKRMSGGISQALVTTGLGLMVAIPIILLHGHLQAKSNRMIQVLDEESAGIVAKAVERTDVR